MSFERYFVWAKNMAYRYCTRTVIVIRGALVIDKALIPEPHIATTVSSQSTECRVEE